MVNTENDEPIAEPVKILAPSNVKSFDQEISHMTSSQIFGKSVDAARIPSFPRSSHVFGKAFEPNENAYTPMSEKLPGTPFDQYDSIPRGGTRNIALSPPRGNWNSINGIRKRNGTGDLFNR